MDEMNLVEGFVQIAADCSYCCMVFMSRREVLLYSLIVLNIGKIWALCKGLC